MVITKFWNIRNILLMLICIPNMFMLANFYTSFSISVDVKLGMNNRNGKMSNNCVNTVSLD